MFRRENNDLGKILANAQQLGMNISKLLGTVTNANATNLNEGDFNGSYFNGTDINSND